MRGDRVEMGQHLPHQRASPASMRRLLAFGKADGHGEGRTPDAVIRALRFQPLAFEVHEVSEAALVGVPGVLDKGGVGRGQAAPLRAHAAREAVHQDQRPGIVVDAIAVTPIRDVEQAVLEHAAAVGHAPHGRDCGRGADRARRRLGHAPGNRPGGSEQLEQALGEHAPDGVAALAIDSLAQGLADLVIRQEGDDFGAKRRAVAEGD